MKTITTQCEKYYPWNTANYKMNFYFWPDIKVGEALHRVRLKELLWWDLNPIPLHALLGLPHSCPSPAHISMADLYIRMFFPYRKIWLIDVLLLGFIFRISCYRHYFFFLSLCIYPERERERETDRQKDNPKQAPYCWHRAWWGAWSHEPQDLSWNQESAALPTEPLRSPLSTLFLRKPPPCYIFC